MARRNHIVVCVSRDAAYKQFETVEYVKVSLAKWINLSRELDLVVRYIEPGHGAKEGQQRWLHDDSNLTKLYQLYNGKKIMLWCLLLILRDLDLDLHVVVVHPSHLQAPKQHPQ